MGHFHAFSLTLDIALNWRPDGELIIGEHWKIFTDFALLCTFSQMGHWSKACDIGFVDLQVSKHGIYQQPPPTLRSSPGEGLGIFDFWRFSGSYLISLHIVIFIFELTLIVGSAGLLDPMSSQGGLENYWMRTCCFRNIFLMFFWTYSWMCKNFSVKKFLRVKASLWKTSLCKNFCVCVKALCVKTSLCNSVCNSFCV